MSLLTWSNDVSVGVRALDEDHKRLIGMINELYDAMTVGKSKDVLGSILGKLASYTVAHFNHEERLFTQTDYPDAEQHKKEHEALKAQVAEIQRKYNNGVQLSLTFETMTFLKNWLINHIKGSDQRYRQHLNACGIT